MGYENTVLRSNQPGGVYTFSNPAQGYALPSSLQMQDYAAGVQAWCQDLQALAIWNGNAWGAQPQNVAVTPGSSSAAAANTAAIQAALNKGGEVYITTPGVIYVNSNLVYQSNTHVVLGENTTITAAPQAYRGFAAGAGSIAIWISQAFYTCVSTLLGQGSLTGSSSTVYPNGGANVTMAQSGNFNAVQVTWTNHGLTEGNGVVIYGVSPTTLTASSGGSGYTTPGTYYNVAATTGGSGTGMRLNVTISGGAATSVVIAFPGTGYVATDTIGFADANVGGRTGGAAFSTTVAAVYTTNPYNGCHRVAKVVDANNFLIYTNYQATYSPTGAIKAIQATQNFHLEGGASDSNYAANGSSNNSNPQSYGWNNFTVSVWGCMDCSIDRHATYSGGYGFHFQYTNNVRANRLVGLNDVSSTGAYGSDGMKVFGPTFNFTLDGFSATLDSASEILSIQTSSPSAAFNWTQPTGYGDLWNLTIRNVTSVQGAGATPSNDVHIYPSDQEVIDLVSFENCNLPYGLFQITANTGFYSKANVRGVTFRKCTAAQTSQSSGNSGAFLLGATSPVTIDRLTLDECSVNLSSANTAQGMSLLIGVSGVTVNNLIFSNMLSDAFPNAGSGPLPWVSLSAGTYNNIVYKNCSIQNCVGGAATFLNITAGVFKNITFDGCYTDTTAIALIQTLGAPTGTVTINVIGGYHSCSAPMRLQYIGSGGTYQINFSGTVFGTVATSIVRVENNCTITIKSAGNNNFNGQTFLNTVGGTTTTLTVYGWDLPVSPKVWTTNLPGNGGTLTTTAGQFCNSTSGGSLMAGPAILGNGSTWYALATGAAGINTAITS